MEYVSFEGLRLDGRRAREIRRARHAFAVDADADGSARFELGNTVVECRVDGPSERAVRAREDGGADAGAVTCAHASDRSGARAWGDARARAFESALSRVLTRAMCAELVPRCEVTVRTTTLCDDGGARTASACAAMLALADAGVPMRGTLSSCTVGFLDGEALVDVNGEEERGRGTELWMCALRAGDDADGDASDEDDAEDGFARRDEKKVLILAEELERGKTTMETYDAMHDLALAGCETLARYLRRAMRDRTRALARARALEKF